MLPVGTGGRGLGVLSVMMVDAPRRWHRHEIQAVQQCAAIVAQSIVALRLSQMQDEQVRRLTELDRQKTDFMATVSHELRTPLTSISGYLELLVDGDFGDVSDAQHVALDIIGRNATRLRGLIEDLLVLNKIEVSGLQAVSEDVAVPRPAAHRSPRRWSPWPPAGGRAARLHRRRPTTSSSASTGARSSAP